MRLCAATAARRGCRWRLQAVCGGWEPPGGIASAAVRVRVWCRAVVVVRPAVPCSRLPAGPLLAAVVACGFLVFRRLLLSIALRSPSSFGIQARRKRRRTRQQGPLRQPLCAFASGRPSPPSRPQPLRARVCLRTSQQQTRDSRKSPRRHPAAFLC